MHAAIVTGVSRGLGEALALALLARRAHVLGVGRRSSAKLSGAHYRFVECDLAAPGRIAAAVLPALRELAALPLSAVTLINNAAVATPLGRSGQLDIGAADASFATNVTAPLALVDLFLKSFDPALERRVLNISSGAAQRAIPGSAVYCMSKAALEMLTRVIAADHAASALSLHRAAARRVRDRHAGVAPRSRTPRRFPARRCTAASRRAGR